MGDQIRDPRSTITDSVALVIEAETPAPNFGAAMPESIVSSPNSTTETHTPSQNLDHESPMDDSLASPSVTESAIETSDNEATRWQKEWKKSV